MHHVIQEQARALAAARAGLDPQRVLEDAVAIQQIPSPTFEELRRAEFLKDRFVEACLQDVEMDAVFNVYGRWPGKYPDRPAVMVSAHIDTVFPLATDLTVRREGERIFGPGMGDNSLGAAGLLALAGVLRKFDIHPAADVWFVADSREEGLGDLGGMRAVLPSASTSLSAPQYEPMARASSCPCQTNPYWVIFLASNPSWSAVLPFASTVSFIATFCSVA